MIAALVVYLKDAINNTTCESNAFVISSKEPLVSLKARVSLPTISTIIAALVVYLKDAINNTLAF